MENKFFSGSQKKIKVLIETNFHQALIMSDGKFSIFLTRPISAVALAISVLLFISTGLSYYRKAKAIIPEE
jgi:TctA family transporter